MIDPASDAKQSANSLRIVVGIATMGRREVLSAMLGCLHAQTRKPEHLIICRVNPDDVDTDALEKFQNVTVVDGGAMGSTPQRNQILRLSNSDIIVFFDDDFFPTRDYLENLEKTFAENLDIVSTTGAVLADGAQGPGISVEQGLQIIEAAKPLRAASAIHDFYGTYGCNMAFRLEPIISNGILFDEKLPLYGWQEDIDFSQSLAPYGRIVKAEALRGVHLGVKVGRTSGLRFGYSQISNPIYLTRKGTMSWRHASKLMSRNIAANLVRSLHSEPWVDRRGRLHGNLLALLDLIRGRIQPDRILTLNE